MFFPQDARDDEYEIKDDVKGYVKHGSSITLYAGEQATIYGLPGGKKYSVEMADPGSKYTTAFDISNGTTTPTPPIIIDGGKKDNPQTGR